MTFKWPEQIATDEISNKLVAHNLPMKEIFKLKFDAFIREWGDENQGDNTLFVGTDGRQPAVDRCGGRLPAIFVLPGETNAKFRIDFKKDFSKKNRHKLLIQHKCEIGLGFTHKRFQYFAS